MKVSYFGDSPVCERDGKIYTLVSLNMTTWKKYTDYFGSVHAFLRQRETKINLSDEQEITYPVNVTTFPSIASPFERIRNLKITREIVANGIQECDMAIIKVPTFVGVEAIKYAEKYNKPYFIEVGECIFDSLIAEKKILKTIVAPFLYQWHRYTIRNTKYGIFVTKNYLQSKYPIIQSGKTASCSNVTIDTTDSNVLEKRIMRIISMDSNVIKFATIGNMTNKLKGLDILLKSLYHLGDDYNIELYVYGQYDMDIWKRYIKSSTNVKIIFEGFIANKAELLKRLDNIDIYIHPSRAEGLPRAVIEAMSRGCPIIGNSIPGTLELIDNDFCFKKNNYHDLSRMIQKMISSKEIMTSQAKKNFLNAQEYTKSVISKTRMAFLDDFIKENQL